MSIISSALTKLKNGTIADATQVMNNFNAIVSEVNSNAAGLNQDNAFSVAPSSIAGSKPASVAILSQLQNNAAGYVSTNTGADEDNIIGVYSPVPASLVDGAVFAINITTANATITPTFTPNDPDISPLEIVKGNGSALLIGDLFGPARLQYNGDLDKFVLLNPYYGVGEPEAAQNNTHTYASANTGTEDAIIGVYTPPPAMLVDGALFTVVLDTPNLTAGPTFTPNDGVIAPLDIVKNYDQAVLAGDLVGAVKLQYVLVLDKFVLINPATQSSPQIETIGASCAANALTVTIAPSTTDFRDADIASGSVTRVLNSATLSLTVPYTAKLGTKDGVAAVLVIVEINNAGTPEAAIINMTGGVALDESSLIDTTEMTAGVDTANIFYSETARTGVAYRVKGYVLITQATAGTWVTQPDKIQGAGGKALSGIGISGAWVDVTSTRLYDGTKYYNATSKVRQVIINAVWNSSGIADHGIIVGGVKIATFGTTQGSSITFSVNPGEEYSCANYYAPAQWMER